MKRYIAYKDTSDDDFEILTPVVTKKQVSWRPAAMAAPELQLIQLILSEAPSFINLKKGGTTQTWAEIPTILAYTVELWCLHLFEQARLRPLRNMQHDPSDHQIFARAAKAAKAAEVLVRDHEVATQ